MLLQVFETGKIKFSISVSFHTASEMIIGYGITKYDYKFGYWEGSEWAEWRDESGDSIMDIIFNE